MRAKATARAAALLGLTGKALADITGASEATVSRITRGERPLTLLPLTEQQTWVGKVTPSKALLRRQSGAAQELELAFPG